MNIVRCKNKCGISYFLLSNGTWTKNVSQKKIMKYWENNKEDLWYNEKDVFLIEKILRHQRKLYLVKFLGYAKPCWIHKKNITKDALDEYYHKSIIKIHYDTLQAEKYYKDKKIFCKKSKIQANQSFVLGIQCYVSSKVQGRIFIF